MSDVLVKETTATPSERHLLDSSVVGLSTHHCALVGVLVPRDSSADAARGGDHSAGAEGTLPREDAHWTLPTMVAPHWGGKRVGRRTKRWTWIHCGFRPHPTPAPWSVQKSGARCAGLWGRCAMLEDSPQSCIQEMAPTASWVWGPESAESAPTAAAAVVGGGDNDGCPPVPPAWGWTSTLNWWCCVDSWCQKG